MCTCEENLLVSSPFSSCGTQGSYVGVKVCGKCLYSVSYLTSPFQRFYYHKKTKCQRTSNTDLQNQVCFSLGMSSVPCLYLAIQTWISSSPCALTWPEQPTYLYLAVQTWISSATHVSSQTFLSVVQLLIFSLRSPGAGALNPGPQACQASTLDLPLYF